VSPELLVLEHEPLQYAENEEKTGLPDFSSFNLPKWWENIPVSVGGKIYRYRFVQVLCR
jgi:hypothetical protein